MEALDIIFLIVTIGIGYALYTILGKRTGHHPSEPGPRFAGKQFSDTEAVHPVQEENIAPPLITGFKQLKQLDPKFDQVVFLSTVQEAFESIIHAFVKGDLIALKKLLKPELYDAYAHAIQERNAENQHSELTFFRFIRAEIKDIQIKDVLASIHINFLSEQIQLLKDQDGKILEGDPDTLDEINEMWVFERDMKSTNSTWVLAETYAP